MPRPGGGWFLVDVVASWSSCRPSLKVTIEAEDEHGDRAGGGNATAAARIVHAIPFVCQPVLLCSRRLRPRIIRRSRDSSGQRLLRRV